MKKQIFILLLLFFSTQALAYRLPQLGDISEHSFSAYEEHKLGQEYFRTLQHYLKIDRDPIVNAYIQEIGHRLASNSPDPHRRYTFFVVDDSSINAFAGPDGYIGINSGLLLKTQSDSELAAVLSHEIAHVAQHHIARSIANQKQMGLSSLGAVLAAAAIGMINPTAGIGILAGANAGSYQHFLTYSRAFEQEADRIAVQIMAKAGYDPCSMPVFLKRIERDEQLNEIDIAHFLQSHPSTESRLADADNRCVKGIIQTSPSADFEIAQARLLSKQTQDVMQFKMQCSKRKDLRNCYAYALTLANQKHYSQAIAHMHSLIKEHPSEIALTMSLADMYAQAGKQKQAIRILEQNYRYNPDDLSLLYQYAQTLLLDKQYKRARTLLEEQTINFPNNKSLLILLSTAQGKSGQLVTAYRTRAKVFLLNHQYNHAREQLEMAKKLTRDATMRVQIKAQIKEISRKIKK